jgi:AraC-like DNA-binding protein
VLDEIAGAAVRHASGFGTGTAVPRLQLVAMDGTRPGADGRQPTAEFVYAPMICFIAEGGKTVVLGERRWETGAGGMFLNLLDVPGLVELPPAGYRSAVMHLDTATVAELLLEFEGEIAPPAENDPAGQFLAPMTPQLIEAVTRWVALLDTPADIPALARRTEAEIVYRLLQTPLAPRLRQFAVADSAQARIRAAAAWIRNNYHLPVRVEHLAAVARMSPATLHRQFKAATGLSPLRFQKQIRLQEARRLLITGQATAASVARVVGYASATQFNREYRGFYGFPPVQDAARIRERLGVQ